MKDETLQLNVEKIMRELGSKSTAVIKHFLIGKEDTLEAAIIYINALVNKDVIDRDILNPLMLHVDRDIGSRNDVAEYLCKKYIPMSNTVVTAAAGDAINGIKAGKTAILVDGVGAFILVDTTGGNFRAISDPPNESTIRGSREGFVENIETNISIIRRLIKDKNLAVEGFQIGRRSQTELALIYIEDIMDREVLVNIKERLAAIDVDSVILSGALEQYLEKYTYSIFPQSIGTERPDKVVSNLMEGKAAMVLNGTPLVLTAPALMFEFFQGVEDYNERTVVSTALRWLRFISTIIVVVLPSIYLTVLRFNAELIPISFITPIVESRIGIALTPFMEIILIEIIVELLREGGLRLPSKTAQTISVVGGIIIGDTAVRSKVVSPTTLLIVGIVVVASFMIPNYAMSLTIRFIRFPMLVLSNVMGIYGTAAGCYFLLVHLSALDSFGVPYLTLKRDALKDTFFRAPLWVMKKRPSEVPHKDPYRQSNSKNKFRGKKDE